MAISCGAASVAALSIQKLRTLPRPLFDRILLSTFILSRLALFSAIFLVLHMEIRGDIHIYMEEASKVASGMLPYRDFASAYAPLFAYMNLLLVRISSSGLPIILLAIVCECIVYWLWLRYGRELFSDERVRNAALFYLTSAVSVQFVNIDGQNNALAALTITGALFLLHRNRALLSGFCLGVGISLVKFLPLAYVPLFFLAAARRWRWMAGLALCCVPVYGAFLLKHAPILVPLTSEGSLRSSGNLPYLAEAVLGAALPSRLWDALVLVVFAVVFFQAARTMRDGGPEVRLRVLSFGTAALMLALLIFSKKSWPPYLILCLFPICLSVPVRWASIAAFAVFNVVACTESSAWWLWMKAGSSLALHTAVLAGSRPALVFLALEALQLAGYFWLFFLALRNFTRRDFIPQPITSMG
jgi:hypothetical protein